jgi:hypothetical protein
MQQGIQTAHLVADISLKNDPYFLTWAKSHKTIIVLNGGNSRDLADTYLFLLNNGNEFPSSLFKEDDDSLNGAITCTGIVLPSDLCECIDMYRTDGDIDQFETFRYQLVDRHRQLVKFIAEHSLAR